MTKKGKTLTKHEMFKEYNCKRCIFAPFNKKSSIICDSYDDYDEIDELSKYTFCDKEIKLHKKHNTTINK